MENRHEKHVRLRFWPIPECREMSKAITASLDDRLSWRERFLMKVHLLACDPCGNFLRQLKFLRTALSHDDLIHFDGMTSLSLEARNRMKRALETAGSI